MSDLNYTSFHAFGEIGGELRRIVDTTTGEVLWLADASRDANGSAGEALAETVPVGVLLSTCHNRPFIRWRSGAGVLTVHRQETKKEVWDAWHSSEAKKKKLNGVVKSRGRINGFSYKSRQRLMRTFASVKLDAPLPMFVTLTHPNDFPTIEESHRLLTIYLKRLRRKFRQAGGIEKLEPQERGAAHHHLAVWGVECESLYLFTVETWHELAGQGDENHLKLLKGLLPKSKPCVEPIRSRRGSMWYASKYLGKTFEIAKWEGLKTGRYWHIFGRSNIPFGEQRIMEVSSGQANTLMRYQRRFAKLKKRSHPSLTVFCNANQWIKKMEIKPNAEPQRNQGRELLRLTLPQVYTLADGEQ